MIIDSLLVELGYDYNDKELKSFKKDINAVTGLMKQLATVAVASAAALTTFVVASTSASAEQGRLSDEIGVSVETLASLDFALKRSGGAADAMGGVLGALASTASQAFRGVGGGIEPLSLLGVSVANTNGQLKDTSSLFLEISAAFQGISNQRQIEFAQKLGLSSSLRLLQKGPTAIRALQKEAHELGVTTGEDSAIAIEFQESLTDLFAVIKSLGREVSRALAPAMTSMVETFTDWFKANREIIAQDLPMLIEKIGKVIKVVTIITATWLAVIAGIPLLIAAAALLFVLFLEDAKVFAEGGDSFIGAMIRQFPILKSGIEDVAVVFNAINSTLGLILTGWKEIIELITEFTLEGFIETLKEIPMVMKAVVNDLIPAASSIALRVNKAIGIDDDLASVGRFFSDGFDRTASFFTGFGGGEDSKVPAITGGQARAVIENVDINIYGGSDTAEQIALETSNQLQQTAQDLITTVDQ